MSQRIDVAQVLIEGDGRVLVVHTVGPEDIDRWGLPALVVGRRQDDGVCTLT